MADEYDDDEILELTDGDVEGAEPETDTEEQGEETEAVNEADEDEDDFVGFGDPEEAPSSQEETSTIRQMRNDLRRVLRENSELRKQVAPKPPVVGHKPTLEDCSYDEDEYDRRIDEWRAQKADADRFEREKEEQAAKVREEWEGRTKVYQDSKASLKVKGYDAAEEAVFGALDHNQQALLMLTANPAALVYALAQDTAKLDELAKLDPARAAMMIGKLEDKVKVMNRRKPPAPDTALRGNAKVSAASSDRELARLEKEAEKTGDRTALIRYRKSLKG